jgi:hypothetical protein
MLGLANPSHHPSQQASSRIPITPAACTTETVMLPSDAAARLKNGSCEDDEPSQDTKRAAARKRGAQSSRL